MLLPTKRIKAFGIGSSVWTQSRLPDVSVVTQPLLFEARKSKSLSRKPVVNHSVCRNSTNTSRSFGNASKYACRTSKFFGAKLSGNCKKHGPSFLPKPEIDSRKLDVRSSQFFNLLKCV